MKTKLVSGLLGMTLAFGFSHIALASTENNIPSSNKNNLAKLSEQKAYISGQFETVQVGVPFQITPKGEDYRCDLYPEPGTKWKIDAKGRVTAYQSRTAAEVQVFEKKTNKMVARWYLTAE